jgi:folate-dependent tRNA-U54 methylase TrmFO/GidA
VPAGSALAVDRDVFSAEVEAALAALPTLEIVRERVDACPPRADHRGHRPADGRWRWR